jgi:membrane protein involved in colicin uptake
MCLNEMANNIHSCQAKALDFLQEENRSASLRQSVSAIKEQIEKEEQITREYLKTLQENEIERLRNEQQQQQQAEMEARRQREAELLNTR